MLGATISDSGGTVGSTTGDSNSSGSSTDTQDLPVPALRLLQQADAKFDEADKALKAGDLTGYAKAVNEARALVARALVAKK